MVTTFNAFIGDQQPQEAGATNTSSTRVYGGAIRHTLGSSEVSQVNHTFHQTPLTGQVGGSVVGTLQRDRSGYSVETIPGVPGSRTGITSAERDGLVRRREGGTGWEDVVAATGAQRTLETVAAEQQATEATAKAAEQQPADSAAFIDAEDDRMWQEAVDDLPQHALDGAVASVVAVVLGQGSLEDTAKSLAQATGMEPVNALEYVTEGFQKDERVVSRVLADMGITDKEAAYAAFREQPRLLQEAMQKLVHTRDVTGFKEMALSYKVATTDVSMYTEAGFQAAVDRATGDILLQHGTGSWARAADVFKASSAAAKASAAAPRGPQASAAPFEDRYVYDRATESMVPLSSLLKK